MNTKIGLFLNSRGDYYGRIVREAESTGKELGISVEVYDAQNTAAKQAQDLVRFARDNAAQAACALVVPQHDVDGAADIESDPTLRLARKVMGIGVGWITLNHGREDVIALLRSEFPKLPASLVSVDNVEFGRMQGRQLRNLVPRGGSILYVRGDPSDSACRNREAGLRSELAHDEIVIEDIDGQWETHIAEPAVHKWVTSPIRVRKVLHAVVGQNDHMALGARQALSRAAQEMSRPDLRDVAVLGGDGLPEFGRKWVDEAKLSCTVCVGLPGRPAVEQLARLWKDGTPLPPSTRTSVTSHPPLSDLRQRLPRA